jgi:uncharacterized protein (UPF0297 family)
VQQFLNNVFSESGFVDVDQLLGHVVHLICNTLQQGGAPYHNFADVQLLLNNVFQESGSIEVNQLLGYLSHLTRTL